MFTENRTPTFTRRRLLWLAGGTGAGLVLTACGGSTSSDGDAATTSGTSPDCVLTPEQIEGPFYTSDRDLRGDITDDRDGVSLELILTVVAAGSCRPLQDATVDVWHADAAGLYSAFEGQGDDADVDTTAATFLRGAQTTDEQGTVEFRTIYPGWYPGRTTHVHVKVRFDDQTQVTSQLYFPDDISAEVYEQPAYRDRGSKDTPNVSDDFGGDEADLQLTVTATGDGYLATHTLGIEG